MRFNYTLFEAKEKIIFEVQDLSNVSFMNFEDHTNTNQDIEGWNNVSHFLYHPFSKKKNSDEVNLSRKQSELA